MATIYVLYDPTDSIESLKSDIVRSKKLTQVHFRNPDGFKNLDATINMVVEAVLEQVMKE